MASPVPLKVVKDIEQPASEAPLYEIRQKIYPRAVSGWFAHWRLGLVVATQLLFYGLPWLTWNARPAVLFDLASRKFYKIGRAHV